MQVVINNTNKYSSYKPKEQNEWSWGSLILTKLSDPVKIYFTVYFVCPTHDSSLTHMVSKCDLWL